MLKHLNFYLFFLCFTTIYGQSKKIKIKTFTSENIYSDSLSDYYDDKTGGYGLKRESDGEPIIHPNFTGMVSFGSLPCLGDESYNTSFIVVRKNHKGAIFDVFGNQLTDFYKYGIFPFQSSERFKKNRYCQSNNFYLLYTKRKLGIVDVQNKKLIPPTFNIIRPLQFNDSLYWCYVEIKRKAYLLSTIDFNLYPIDHEVISILSNKYFVANNEKTDDWIAKSLDDEMTEYPKSQWPYNYHNVEYDITSNSIIINIEGDQIIKRKHESFALYEDTIGTFFWSWDFGKVGVYDKKGHIILDNNYIIDKVDLNTKDYDGKTVYDCNYGDRFPYNSCGHVKRNLKFYEGYSKTLILKDQTTDKYGLVNYRGEIILPFEYECYPKYYQLKNDSLNYGLVWKKNGKYGLNSSSSEMLIPFDYDSLCPLEKIVLKPSGINNLDVLWWAKKEDSVFYYNIILKSEVDL